MSADAKELRECACCGYETSCRSYDAGGLTSRRLWFCEVCASTFLTLIYRDKGADARLARSIGWIANKILDELKHEH